MKTDEIRILEKKAAKGWAANETIEYDGWEMRFGNGYTGRANSVSVYEDSSKRMEDKVVYCENMYSSKGLPCEFKVTDEDKELSQFLINRGYKVVTPSDVMILEIDEPEDKEEIYKDVVFSDEPSEWFDPYFAFEGFTDEKKIEAYKQFHENTKVEKLYVTVLKDGKPVAVASCAIEGEYSLLHNVIVDPAYRGLGLGRKLCLAAIYKSKELGAKYSYLQVIKDNSVAISLYNKLGYKKIYEYCYLKQNK